jgi:hypothetical protein
MTPLAPGQFLLIASLGNICKAVAGVAMGASKAAINRHFAIEGNLGDLTAKSQAQGITSYLCGLAIGIPASLLVGNSWPRFIRTSTFTRFHAHVKRSLHLASVFGLFSIFSLINLTASYSALSRINLNCFNRTRLSILIAHWMDERKMLTPEQVAQVEGFSLK